MTSPMTSYDPVQAVRDALHAAGKRTENAAGGGFMAQCPAHEDRTPSLSVGVGVDGQALLWCFAGCDSGEIAAALGLSSAALFADYRPSMASVTPLHTVRPWIPEQASPEPKREHRLEKVCHYDYAHADGSPCARVVRFIKVDVETGKTDGKSFTQQHYDHGNYLNGVKGLQIPIYHADLIAAAIPAGLPILVCEGEKDVDAAINTWSMFATCNAGGAGKWQPHHTDALRGAKHVVVIADNDNPGREHAAQVAAALSEVVERVEVKAAAVGKDLADHIAAGYGYDDLVAPEESVTVDEAPAADAQWWDDRGWLRHIHTFARSRMVSPYALLAVTLVRVVANVPPWVTLPALVGGRASLNLFCVLVGPSGAGKSAVCSASDELLPGIDPWAHIGSGEGLLHAYVHRVNVEDPDNPGRKKSEVQHHTHQVTAIVDEVDTLTALASRQGATLLPTLRTAWTGSSVGFGYADPAKRLHMNTHMYRLGLVVGAQPTRCVALFDDADAGTPQRFIWAPLIDPEAPDDLPANPGPLPPRPGWDGNPKEMTVPDVLRHAVVNARRLALRTGDTQGLDGHALLNRVKVAAAIALMEDRLDITDDDWHLAGRIQATSDNTRAWVQNTLMREREDVAVARAKGRAREAVVVDETLSDARIGRVARVIARAVHAAGEDGLTAGAARKRLASRDRDDFEAGLEFARAAQWVAVEEHPHHKSGDLVDVLKPGKETP